MGEKNGEPGGSMGTKAPENSKDTQQRRRELGNTLGKKLSELIIATKDPNVHSKLLPSTTANLLGMDIHNREVWELLIPDGEELARVFALLDEYESIHVVGAPRIPESIQRRQDPSQEGVPEDDSGMNARLILNEVIEVARRAVLGVPDHASADTAQDADTIEFAPAQPTTAGRSSFLRRLKSLFGPKK
jgi:hypothetical protein